MLRRLLQRRHLRGRAQPGPPAPFVVGVGRSGTTMLRLMLDTHPEMAVPPETHFVPSVIRACKRWRVTPETLLAAIRDDRNRRWGDMGIPDDEYLQRLRTIRPLNAADALRALYGLYAGRAGKARWGDKTPDYVKRMKMIGRILPEARFVHLIRDGRDVGLSLNTRLAKGGIKNPVPYATAAQRWQRQIGRAREHSRQLEHYLEIRYEDLVLRTEPTLRKVCQFIELDFDPAMLSYHERAEKRLTELARDLPARDGKPARPGEERLEAHALTREPPRRSRVGAWREKLSAEEVADFEAVADGLLSKLGYPVGERQQATSAILSDPRH